MFRTIILFFYIMVYGTFALSNEQRTSLLECFR